MMGMSIPYEQSGRNQQKSRTKQALVGAARQLLAEGVTPTIEQAAAAAAISRTTAYRYFTNQRDLLVAAYPEVDETSLLAGDPSGGAAGRLDRVVESIGRQVIEHEHELRTQLRLSLDPRVDRRQLALRQGRAIGWIQDALAPLADRMTRTELRTLAVAVRAGCGIEAFVWMRDVADLSNTEAVKVMRWSAQALLRVAQQESDDRAGAKTAARRAKGRAGASRRSFG